VPPSATSPPAAHEAPPSTPPMPLTPHHNTPLQSATVCAAILQPAGGAGAGGGGRGKEEEEDGGHLRFASALARMERGCRVKRRVDQREGEQELTKEKERSYKEKTCFELPSTTARFKRRREGGEFGRRGVHEELKRELYKNEDFKREVYTRSSRGSRERCTRGVPSYHRPTTKLKHVMPLTKGN
jgi:hypothetical protein